MKFVCLSPGIFLYRGPFIFYEVGGASATRESPFKNCMTSLSLPVFFTYPSFLWSSNFLGWLPAPTKNNPLPDFSFFHILCYSLLHVIVLGMKTIFTFRTEYRELFIRKLKSKEREVNFGSPIHSSPGAMSWHFSVLVGQLWEDSSAASNVFQLPLLTHSCCSSIAALARGGLSICLVLEHVAF